MSSLSDYAENELLDHVFGAATYSRPATVYLELFTADPNDAGTGGTVVATANGYTGRTAVTNNSTNFPAATGGAKTNGVDITIGTASGSWGTVVGIGVYDASTSGNLLAYHPLGTDKAPVAGKRVKILAGTLDLSLTGAWEESLANAVLDHMFGGGDFTPDTTLYYALDASGTELTGSSYARVSATNNSTNFPAASGGAKANGAAVTFGPATGSNWATATHVSLYTASSGGTRRLRAALSASRTVLVGETATFDIGEFDLSLA